MSGSIYGRRAFGIGRYSRAGTLIGGVPVSMVHASKMQVSRAAAMRARNVAPLLASTTALLAGSKLWDAIPVAPCQPWLAIGAPACALALPNSAGAMFS